MKRILAFFLCAVLILSVAGCQGKETMPEPEGKLKTPDGEIYPESFLILDGLEVSFTEFRYYYLNYKNMHLTEDADYFNSTEREEALKQEVLDNLLDAWAVKLLAKEHKVSLTSSEKEAVQASIDKTIAQYQNEEEFLQELAKSYMNFSLYEKTMEFSSLYLKLFDTLYQDGGKEAWTDEEFFAYYREHYLAVQQIYLPFEDGETASDCPSTTSKAQNILKEYQDGADFWKLVETYGKDDRMLDYPDGYYLTQGQAEEVLYQASKALKIGEVSQPVVGKSGVYLIKRMELSELRMTQNRQTALFGYTDTFDQHYPGAYDEDFNRLYSARADEIKVEFSPYWDLVSTQTVL